MGRTNWILLALGLLGCVALSLMAQHTMRVYRERVVDPIAAEVDKAFGARLHGATSWRVESDERGARHGRLALVPTPGVNEENLARDASDYVWRRIGRGISSMLVVCDSGLGEALAFDVPAPWQPARPLVRVEMPELGPPAVPR